MPQRRNTTKYRNLQPRNTKKKENSSAKQKCKPFKRPPGPPGGDSTDDEIQEKEVTNNTITVIAQINTKSIPEPGCDNKNTRTTANVSNAAVLPDPVNKGALVSSNSKSESSIQLPKMTSSSVCSLPASLSITIAENNVDEAIILYTEPVNVVDLPQAQLSPSIISPKVDVRISNDSQNNILDQNKENYVPLNTIQVTAQMNAKNILQPYSVHQKQHQVTTAITSNGAIYSDPDTIEALDLSRPKCKSASPLPLMSTSKSLLLPVSCPIIVTDENVEDSIIIPLHSESVHAAELIQTPLSTIITGEVVVRTSHDPKNNIIVEEIDLLPSADQPLDTSTPLGSPSTSTIMHHIEREELSFSNINTPSSSMCLHSTINDETYAPSLCDSDTTDTTEESNTTTDRRQTKRKRNVKKKTDIGKVRKVTKSEWLDNKRKQLKNRGLSYTSRGGKQRSKKSILPACGDNCRLKCHEKIEENIRKIMFERFWSLGDRVRQWEFLARWCERIGKRRITTEGPSKRKFSVKYHLPTTLGIDNEERVVVCKNMFLNTFAIGEGVVRTSLRKISDGDGLVAESDKRGHHHNHPTVMNDEMVKSVCDHVKSFSPVEAHYTRKDSSKLYLDSDLTMSKMFKLYKEWAPESYSSKAETVRQYTDIVNENFNIEFHRPKKDQCDECVAYKNLPKPVAQDEQDRYDGHLRNKNLARSLKNEDKLSAINSPTTIVTAAFDFQKVHSAPHAESSILYYKRKLNVFNFTIFEMGQKIGKCYMWHEGTAKRGANEVASCVYDFIKNQSAKGIKTINLYSDNCGGQNRNRIVFIMYMLAAKEFKVNITHRFFEKGHTQNENDSIHALIERCAKNKEIYTPEQWFALVRWAKETADPYVVKEIATNDILDFKKLLAGKNWTKNDKNQKIMWSKIREVYVSYSEPDVLYYKNSFQEPHHRIFVRRTNKRKQNLSNEELTPAYTGPLPIADAKLTDLKYLCLHNIIPSQYHNFFNSLTCGDSITSSEEEE